MQAVAFSSSIQTNPVAPEFCIGTFTTERLLSEEIRELTHTLQVQLPGTSML